MSWTRDIYKHINRPVGKTTLRKLVLAFLVFLIPILSFTYIAHKVFEGDTLQVDDRILLGIHHRSTPILNEVVLHTTDVGGVAGVIGLTMIIVGIYLWRHRYQACVQILAGVGGAGILNFLLKYIFERDRPNLWQHLIFENSYSFPSGHAMLSSALAFSIVAVLWHGKYRIPAIIGGAAFVLYIGFTRLYLGVHYPTDIIAGWLVSFSWVILVGFVLGAVVVPEHKKTVSFKKQPK